MKKTILLAMAAAVVAMFAIPASASANWLKHHNPITTDETVAVEITGTDIEFEGEFGAYECDTISKVDFTGGTTTGTITTFEPHGEATNSSVCRGTGAQGHCEPHKFTPHGLPWTIHTHSADTVSITTGTITTINTGFLCFDPDLTPGTVYMHVTPGETLTTSTAHLTGTLQSHNPSETVNVNGTVHILGAITYGI